MKYGFDYVSFRKSCRFTQYPFIKLKLIPFIMPTNIFIYRRINPCAYRYECFLTRHNCLISRAVKLTSQK